MIAVADCTWIEFCRRAAKRLSDHPSISTHHVASYVGRYVGRYVLSHVGLYGGSHVLSYVGSYGGSRTAWLRIVPRGFKDARKISG